MGVGKSTLARKLVGRRRLALDVDIDELRIRLGSWREDPESKPVARALGFGLTRNHLEAGHDVLLPALICRFDVIDQIEAIAMDVGAEFTEVVLVAPADEILERLATQESAEPHPRDGLSVDEFRSHVEFALQELRRRAELRPNALLVDLSGLDAQGAVAIVSSAIGWWPLHHRQRRTRTRESSRSGSRGDV